METSPAGMKVELCVQSLFQAETGTPALHCETLDRAGGLAAGEGGVILAFVGMEFQLHPSICMLVIRNSVSHF